MYVKVVGLYSRLPMMAPDSARTKSPSWMTGAVPKGLIFFSSAGANFSAVRSHFLISYGTSSSSYRNTLFNQRIHEH